MARVSTSDLDSAREHLLEHGYAVLEGMLAQSELERFRSVVDELFLKERSTPFDPGDGPASTDDDAIEAYLAASYSVSKGELSRLMRRIRYTRESNNATPWPVTPQEVNKTFLHLPTLFDEDKSQRIWNLLNKAEICSSLVEDETVLSLARDTLSPDCVLSDCSATSIGPHTGGGSWHVDVPLGQLPEPLPDFPLTIQNIWILDDFSAENGATCVVPGSHHSRKKPSWGTQSEEERVLTAPAGSVVMWLSNTWHRSGANVTDKPRRGIICYYCHSWIKPFTDFRSSLPANMVERFSPRLRYLLGFSANGLVQG